MRSDLEYRIGELRTTGRTLYGLAAPTGRAAVIGGGFSETIMAGAFAASLARDDILALADHKPDALLGRTRSKSLRLTETAAGLEYALDLPTTSLGNDLLTLARRNDLSGVSIGFICDAETWPYPGTRQLRAVSLHEISILTGNIPAYDATTVALRNSPRFTKYETVSYLSATRRRLLDLL